MRWESQSFTESIACSSNKPLRPGKVVAALAHPDSKVRGAGKRGTRSPVKNSQALLDGAGTIQ
jgi:hypothetical protein